MGLSLTVLGTCGSYPGPAGACSGYLVRGEGATIWLDAGNGTMANLQRFVDLHGVDAVVLSHEHPDHWSDIEGFRVACAYVIERGDVPLFAPRGLGDQLYPDFAEVFSWHTVRDGDGGIRVGGLTLSFSRTDHGPETLAVRVDGGGRSLLYSADTGPAWPLDALGDGIDLALCEATFTRPYEGSSKHLSGRQAGQAARQAGIERLMLTHFWPTLGAADIVAEAEAELGRPVETATMNKEYEV